MLGDFPLQHKIVLVTGGGSGIGLAFCDQALSCGARVIIADLRLSPAASQLAEKYKTAGSVAFLQCDATKWEDLESTVAFSEKTFGDVPDVYVANAGIGESPQSSFWEDLETSQYLLLSINLVHPIKLARIAIRTLTRKRKKGVVLVTSSVAGVNGHYATPLYVASKHGTIGFIKSMVRAESELGVKVVGARCDPSSAGVLDGNTKKDTDLGLMDPTEIATRMVELVEKGSYSGGTALGVFRTGEAEIVADGTYSLLEELAPSDLAGVRKMAESK